MTAQKRAQHNLVPRPSNLFMKHLRTDPTPVDNCTCNQSSHYEALVGKQWPINICSTVQVVGYQRPATGANNSSQPCQVELVANGHQGPAMWHKSSNLIEVVVQQLLAGRTCHVSSWLPMATRGQPCHTSSNFIEVDVQQLLVGHGHACLQC